MEIVARTERRVYGLALIIAPLLLGLSTFFWGVGTSGYVGGAIQVYALLMWIPAMLGLLTLLRVPMPRFSVWAVLLVCWVCIGGNNYGMEGIFVSRFAPAGADAVQIAELRNVVGVAGIFVLNLPGLAFPLTLILFAFFLWHTESVSPLQALLLGLGAIAFPISRITHIAMIAHLADLLLLVGAGGIGLQLLRGDDAASIAPRTVAAGDD